MSGTLSAVSGDAMTILRDALAFSEDDRAGLAAELLASLPPPPGILEIDSEEFLREIERRARSVESGEAQLDDWDTVENRIRSKLAGE